MAEDKKEKAPPKKKRAVKVQDSSTEPVKKIVRRRKKVSEPTEVKVKETSPEDIVNEKVVPADQETNEPLVKNKKTVQQQNISPDEKVSINRVSTHKPSQPRRQLIDSSEIKPNIKYISGLKGKRSIVGLTAYDAIMSKLVSKAGVDFILVGDSVGTTLLGYETTIPVTIDDMVHHTAAVRRGRPGCLVISDLPFGEASLSFDRLLGSARRLMQNGADAVKIEGGKDVADDIEKLVATGIPVMGHIGLLPQTVKAIGGYRKFGGSREEADSLYTDAISLEEAGCFAVIAEMMDEKIAAQLASQILPPLIGIGSGNECDGQILVTHDLIGLTPSPLPSFVKPCASLGLDGLNALSGYVQRTRKIPVKKK
jgi:3-methyl-2-oxobutanoate hydroxymethyltransferase